jgi:hypothetical protein
LLSGCSKLSGSQASGEVRFANGEVVEVDDAESDAEEYLNDVVSATPTGDQMVLSGLEPDGYEVDVDSPEPQAKQQTSFRPLYPQPQEPGKQQSRASKALCSCCLM